MGVGVDQLGTLQGNNVGVTTFDYTGLTVSAGGTNTALLAWLLQGVGSNPSGITLTWDNGGTNQAMTQIDGASTTGIRHRMWGLLNPTPGNLTLRATWTTADTTAIVAVSLTGVVQSSVAAAFINGTAQTYTSTTTPTLAMPTPGAGDLVFGAVTNGNTLTDTTGFSQVWNTRVWTSGQFTIGDYTGSPSPTFVWGVSPANAGSVSGVEVVWDGTTGGAVTVPYGIAGMVTSEW